MGYSVSPDERTNKGKLLFIILIAEEVCLPIFLRKCTLGSLGNAGSPVGHSFFEQFMFFSSNKWKQ